jgi:SAM-dependent methyltransferase
MVEKLKQEFYPQGFYDYFVKRSYQSARIILGMLFSVYKPQSVIDIGCGAGAWLSAAEALGCSKLVGVDGEWVDRGKLLSKKIELKTVDFEEPLMISGQYDLCISMEVAEHISERHAGVFIQTLSRMAPVVLFSGATKFQGGSHHVNEQWQSYWIALFRNLNFECFDIFRGNVWDNLDVEYWYSQNALLFIRKDFEDVDKKALLTMEKRITDVVHPRAVAAMAKTMETPTLRYCLRCFKNYCIGRFKKRSLS